MTTTDEALVEAMARTLAHSHGLDFDEVCGVDANPDEGYCDSGTCIASGYEDHDAEYARVCYLADARSLLPLIQAELARVEKETLRRAAEVAEHETCRVTGIRALPLKYGG